MDREVGEGEVATQTLSLPCSVGLNPEQEDILTRAPGTVVGVGG